jgi:hypothetical protein
MGLGRLSVIGFLSLALVLVGCTPVQRTSSGSLPTGARARVPTQSSMFDRVREQEEAEDHDEGASAQARLTVIEQEWHLLPETDQSAADTITFVVTNQGAMPHGFGVRQNGERVAFLPDLESIQPGETQVLVAPLRPGSYELIDPGTYPVNGRLISGGDAGMRVTFTVT